MVSGKALELDHNGGARSGKSSQWILVGATCCECAWGSITHGSSRLAHRIPESLSKLFIRQRFWIWLRFDICKVLRTQIIGLQGPDTISLMVFWALEPYSWILIYPNRVPICPYIAAYNPLKGPCHLGP